MRGHLTPPHQRSDVLRVSALTKLAYPVLVRGYRQHMAIMNLVWPITALYRGSVAAYFYFRPGRQMSQRWAREHGMDMDEMMSSDQEDLPGLLAFARKNWWPISKGVSTAAPAAPSATSSVSGSST